MSDDPTPEQVHAALAILAAAETAREKAAETEHVTEQATASHVPVASEPVSPAAPVESPTTSSAPSEPVPAAKPVPSLVEAVDPYLARSVKSSPNGF